MTAFGSSDRLLGSLGLLLKAQTQGRGPAQPCRRLLLSVEMHGVFTSFTKLEKISAQTYPQCPASIPALMRYHLLKKPQVGGNPIMDKAPTVKPIIVSGILRNKPSKALTRESPTLSTMIEAAMKRQKVIAASERI